MNSKAVGTSRCRDSTLYAVGDVHGHAEALHAVLEQVRADACREGLVRPRLVMLGDLTSRGPDSKGVLDILVDPRTTRDFRLVVLRGNHEASMLSAMEQPDDPASLAWLFHGGADTVESYGISLRGSPGDAIRELREAIPGPHVSLLWESRGLWEEPGLFFSHAGIDPSLPLDRQGWETLCWGNRHFLDHPGPFGARVVHGHYPTRDARVQVMEHRIGVDTGAGVLREGCLSAVAIRPDEGVEVFSTPAPGSQA